MKVTLISHTPNAVDLLLFTKSTRLNMTANLMEEIAAWPEEKKMAELEYMANTIPSSWEFVDYVFAVEGVSRAFTHQQVRTRSGSYAQQTMRILDMGNFDFVRSVFERKTLQYKYDRFVNGIVGSIQSTYKGMIEEGIPPEDARGILPTNISTNIVCKFNLRAFSDLAKSRTGGRTQSEYQKVINAMVDEVLKVHPWAEKFIFTKDRDYFNEIEEFAKRKFPDLKDRGELLKIVDAMRKEG